MTNFHHLDEMPVHQRRTQKMKVLGGKDLMAIVFERRFCGC